MVDSVIDIVGTAWCIDHLGIDEIQCAPPPLNRGWIKSAHGIIPLPAPATAHLLLGYQINSTQLPHELVTPTGAAMIRAWVKQTSHLPQAKLMQVGWGAGNMNLSDRPNLLRLMVFETDGFFFSK